MLTEHAIRPVDTAAEQKRLFAADREWLYARQDRFVSVPCVACGATASDMRWPPSFRICKACETVYVSPRPSPELLAEYYARSESYRYWNDVIFPASEASRRERIFRPRAERILSITRGKSLIEIGAGFGTFLEIMREKIDVTAIEPTPSLAETCRKRGLRVIEKRAEDAVADPADIAVSFEVLEHTFDPGAFLAACKRLTRDWLVLTCPNVKGFDVEVLGVESPAIDHEHLNYFHPASLTAFVERHGFKVEAIETPGQLDADIVRNRVLNGFELREPFLRRVLIDEWDKHGAAFQAFLAQQQMSSHMWLVARKNA